MKQDVKLYIDDMLVDFSNELSMPFTYQLEDTKNPTIIKNSFTKTISIVGTKQNNKIFGEIYNLDREQLDDVAYLVGAYFNPSFRTPFKIFKNGELIESGYMQLNTVTIKNKLINYNITLYGGLGDFFYNLSYNKENEPLQLKDLVYGVAGVEDKNKEFDFNFTKNTIRKCWEKEFGSTTRTFEDFINFIPSYNGLYEDFDNDKVLINTSNSSVFTTTATTVDGESYTTVNGYALGELKKNYTEWEVKSLRSVSQRPALRLRGFIEACCNPQNNGGYEVELDKGFFNVGNPYYDKAYIALPLLPSSIETEGETIESTVVQETLNAWCGTKNGTTDEAGFLEITPASSFTVSSSVIDLTNFPVGSTIDLDIDFQLFFKTSGYTGDLYPTCLESGKSDGLTFYKYPLYNSVLIQATILDAENPLYALGYSDIYNLTNITELGYSSPSQWVTWWNWYGANVTPIFGKFVYDTETEQHYFKSDSGNNTFNIKLNKIPSEIKRIKINLEIRKVGSYNNDDAMYTYVYQTAGNLDKRSGYWSVLVDNPSSTFSVTTPDAITSNIKITKQTLLKTEKKPIDYLLSYSKMFGLYFEKDLYEKKVYIKLRNNYFTGNIVNIQDRIDYSKEMEIHPILFDKKFYLLKSEENETQHLKKYKNEYGVEYGQKRINTNYNFNSETEDLLKDNVFKNVLSITDSSYYYRSFFNSSGEAVPSFVVDNLTYQLFNSKQETTDIKLYGTDMVDVSKTQNWNTFGGYDFMDKLEFFTVDNGEKNLADMNGALVFFNGYIKPKTVDGTEIKLWVTDDVDEMYTLNENPCHLYTENAYDIRNRWIAYPVNSLPHFSRYLIDNNNVKLSWDFGVPKETFIPQLNYTENNTIYNKYLADYYADQLDINTKKTTLYLNLDGLDVNSSMLKDFYYFNNCYWALNKIDNYDINKYGSVKCEFIKINNINSYLKKLDTDNSYIDIGNTEVVVDYKAGEYTFTVNSTYDWEVFWYNDLKITYLSKTSGTTGETKVTINYNQNNSYEEENFYLSIVTKNDSKRIRLDFIQKPNPANTVVVSGTILYYGKGIIPNGHILICDAANPLSVYSMKYLDEYTGEFSVYVQKNIPVLVEIQSTYNEVVYSKQMIFTEDSVINWLLIKGGN